MLQLGSRVGGTGGCDDAIQTVDSVGKRDVVNLAPISLSKTQIESVNAHRVQGEQANDPIPLGPLIGDKPQTLANRPRKEISAFNNLRSSIRPACQAARVGIPRRGQRVTAVFLAVEELLQGDGIGHLCSRLA